MNDHRKADVAYRFGHAPTDPLPFGGAIPAAHLRVVDPQVAIDAQQPLSFDCLGPGEQDDELRIGLPAVDHRLFHDLGPVGVLFGQAEQDLEVTAAALPLVELSHQRGAIFSRARPRP